MYLQNSSNIQAGGLRVVEDKIALWTSLTPQEMARGVRWFASRPAAEQVSIMMDGEQKILPRLQKANPEIAPDSTLRYAAFVIAIRQAGFDLIRKRGYRVHGHKDFEKFEALRQGTLQSLKNRKRAPLRQVLLAHWGDVRTLKRGGTGFLLISRYLVRAHSIKASPSYIARLWREIEG